MNLSKNILQKGTKNKDFLDIYNKVLSFGNRNSSLKFSWSFHTDKLDIEISPENEEFDDNKRDAIERFRDYFNKCLLEAISRSFSFIQGTISLYTSSLSVSVHENLALVSLALALLLFGLGKGSRRGLGAIKIKSIGINEDVDNELIRTKNHIEKAIENPINIVRLIDYGVNLATRLIEQLKSRNIKFRQRKEKMRLPKIPAFYEGAYQIIIKKINQQNRAPSQTAPLENGTQQGSAKEDQRNKQDIINLALWKEICRLNEKLFLRRGKLGLYLRSIREQQQAARRLDHYILGLPRSGSPKRNTKIYSVEIDLKRRGKAKLKETKKRKTGFAGEHQRIGRRASPIIISAINESFVVVTYFMSLDWPTKLVWFSAEKKETEEQKVKQRRRPPRKKEEDTREVEWRKLRDVLLDIARKLPRLICGGRLITC